MITFSTTPYHRRPPYLIQTRLHDQTRVEKIALSSQSLPHLKTIAANHSRLRQQIPFLNPLTYKLSHSSPSLSAPFLPYPSFAKLIETALLTKDFSAAHQYFVHFLSLIYQLPVKKTKPLKNPTFVKFFSSLPPNSPVSSLSFSCLAPSSLDLNFSNLLLSPDNQPHLIDQEWLFPDYSLPRSFLLFCATLDLSLRLQDAIRNFRSPSFICYQFSPNFFLPQVWLDSLLLDHSLLPLFTSWYNHFQSRIHLSSIPLPTPTLPLSLDYNSSFSSSPSRFNRLKHQFFLALPPRLQGEYTFFKENGIFGELSRPVHKLARHAFTTTLAATSPSSSLTDILLISGSNNTVSHRHRVLHLCDQLDSLNLPYHSLTIQNYIAQIPSLPLSRCRALFIHRAPASPQLLELIHFFRSRHLPVIFDIDDLVFDPQRLASLASIKSLSPLSLNLEHQHILGFLSVLKHATHATTTTLPLKSALEQLFPHLSTSLLPNHLDQPSFDQASLLAQAHLSSLAVPKSPKYGTTSPKRSQKVPNMGPLVPKGPKFFTLGYFPGTATHDRDFLILAPALQQIFSLEPSIHLKIVGFLSLPPQLEPFLKTGQITHVPFVPYSELISQYQDIDLNLCPLEPTPFNAAKSDLKYFFAGCCAIPTLASPSPVLAAIKKRGGGLNICTNSLEWQTAILDLFHHRSKLATLARAAYSDCSSHYSPSSNLSAIKKLLAADVSEGEV